MGPLFNATVHLSAAFTLMLATTAALAQPAGEAALALRRGEFGCIRGDCLNGNGLLLKQTGRGRTIYRGDFQEGQYHGFGRLTYVDENAGYKGDWRMGERHGRGTYWELVDSAANTYNVYIGQWENDRRNGQGTQAFNVKNWELDRYTEAWLSRNTENYTGNFRNDVFYGHGTYRWPDGTKYVGEWAANKKHGDGYWDYGNGFISRRTYEFGERVLEY